MWKIILLLSVNLFARTSCILSMIMLFGYVLGTIPICLVDSIRLLSVVLNIWKISWIVWQVILSINLFTRTSSILGVVMLFGYVLRSISICLMNSVTLLSIILNIWQVTWVMWKIILSINLFSWTCSIHCVIMLLRNILGTISISLMNGITLLSIILDIRQVTRIMRKIILVANINISLTL